MILRDIQRIHNLRKRRRRDILAYQPRRVLEQHAIGRAISVASDLAVRRIGCHRSDVRGA